MIKPSIRLKVLAGLMCAYAGCVSAATFTNVPTGATNALPFAFFGNAPNGSGNSPQVGQVFALSEASTLSSFSFYALGDQSASFQLNVAQWNPDTNANNQATNFVGPSLLTTTGSAATSYSAAARLTTIGFSNLGLNLDAGTKYVAYLTSNDPTVAGIQLSRTQTAQDTTGFGIGNAYFSTTPGVGWVFPFNGNGFLSLQYTAITTPVPEPESYAMLLAGLGLMGAVARRRQGQRA